LSIIIHILSDLHNRGILAVVKNTDLPIFGGFTSPHHSCADCFTASHNDQAAKMILPKISDCELLIANKIGIIRTKIV